jgi:hypothetical protein
MAITRKIFTDVMGGRDAAAYIGNKGEIFYDEDVGSLRLSDGTTAGGTPLSSTSVSRYVAVNAAGVISGSYNGIDWNDYTSNLNGIVRVAVGPTKIVYIADSSVDNDFDSLWYADNYDTEPTEVGGMSEKQFSEVKYFKSISKFVAVGEGANGPELHYSSDGVTWISSSIDPTYLTELDVSGGENIFSDISENSAGFFILSNNAALGGFFLPNITDTMDASTHIDLSNVTDADLDEISWVDSGAFIGWHLFIQGEGTDWWVNDALDPTTQQFSDFGLPIQGVLEDNIGVSSSTSEIVVGEYAGITTIMVATNNGQIMYWPAIPAGPYVSVPKPYTATISGWTSASPTVVSYTTDGGNSDGNQGGEKFVVSGSENGDYNGTYYLGEGNTVYTDDELTVPFDTTGLTAFTGTATITWSHGQYIDALHYSDGIFYAGNDNEEIFVSTNGGETWTQADQLLGGQGEGDGYLQDIDSFIGDTTSVNIGDITFSGVEIRGTAAEMRGGLIKLVPATSYDGHNYLDNGQYVQIYPTNQYDAPHIHIAAGWGDNTDGDLFLGDDDKYVQVNHDGNVSIQAYDPDENDRYTWSFENTGNLRFPDGSLQNTAYTGGTPVFGCFHKVADVVATEANAAFSFDWFNDATAHVNTQGVAVVSGNPTRVAISSAGSYLVTVEMLVKSEGNAARDVFLWLSKNNSDVADSGIKIEVKGGGLNNPVYEYISKQWLVHDVAENDYLELKFAVSRIDLMKLEYTAAQTTPYARPALPSAILTITKI